MGSSTSNQQTRFFRHLSKGKAGPIRIPVRRWRPPWLSPRAYTIPPRSVASSRACWRSQWRRLSTPTDSAGATSFHIQRHSARLESRIGRNAGFPVYRGVAPSCKLASGGDIVMRARIRQGNSEIELGILYRRRRTVQSLIRAIERYQRATARAVRSGSRSGCGSSPQGAPNAE